MRIGKKNEVKLAGMVDKQEATCSELLQNKFVLSVFIVEIFLLCYFSSFPSRSQKNNL